jgi:hypothetical protein
MLTKMAMNRAARTAARKLGEQGVVVSLPDLKRVLKKIVKNAPMPPEVALEETNDLRIIALETALQLHQAQIDARPEAMRWQDSHQWTDNIRCIYRAVLKELQR